MVGFCLGKLWEFFERLLERRRLFLFLLLAALLCLLAVLIGVLIPWWLRLQALHWTAQWDKQKALPPIFDPGWLRSQWDFRSEFALVVCTALLALVAGLLVLLEVFGESLLVWARLRCLKRTIRAKVHHLIEQHAKFEDKTQAPQRPLRPLRLLTTLPCYSNLLSALSDAAQKDLGDKASMRWTNCYPPVVHFRMLGGDVKDHLEAFQRFPLDAKMRINIVGSEGRLAWQDPHGCPAGTDVVDWFETTAMGRINDKRFRYIQLSTLDKLLRGNGELGDYAVFNKQIVVGFNQLPGDPEQGELLIYVGDVSRFLRPFELQAGDRSNDYFKESLDELA